MDYILLAIAVLTAIGLGLVYLVFEAEADAGCPYTNCTGNCNQGRNCDCKDKN